MHVTDIHQNPRVHVHWYYQVSYVCLTPVFTSLVASYNPADFYNKNAELKQCIDQIQSGYFTPNQPDLFTDIANTLLYSDRCSTDNARSAFNNQLMSL